ncbi:CAP domain-containing protein [Halobacillus yeomjeoni]|uniref:CAP domain-containing protein n=1 Tax=Halobacillus yeomjeoni TaxID=311194 RepID=A0A931HSH0_9BACI|nr:CAP domain-containing protein [Halobacillus yeomjeoni]MBH0229022.1 CAP domain-containing protein [Halobacillus yeomjeoni]
MNKAGVFILLIVTTFLFFLLINNNGQVETDPVLGDAISEAEQETMAVPDEDSKQNFSPSYMGAKESEILAILGEPDRVDPSEFGYEWWIYEKDPFLQLGFEEGQVVTGIYFDGKTDEGTFEIGQTYQQIKEEFTFDDKYSLDSEGSYTLELTERDIQERPLVRVGEEWTAQLYFDNVTDQLFAVRVIRNDILLKLQPYRVVYRGELPIPENLNRQDWKAIESGVERQIMAMTNYIRSSHGLRAVSSHKRASAVAFKHSRDMNVNNYFSHYSLNGASLKDRLEEINYIKAGENIAAQYVDATAAVHGWLNSPGHRKAMLEPAYTHLGVGVYQRYYTQNFLTLP